MLNQAINTQIQQLVNNRNSLISQQSQFNSNLEAAGSSIMNSKSVISSSYSNEEINNIINYLIGTTNDGLGLISQVWVVVNEDRLREVFDSASNSISAIRNQFEDLGAQEKPDIVTLLNLVPSYSAIYKILEDAIWQLELTLLVSEQRKSSRNSELEEQRDIIQSFRCDLETAYAPISNGVELSRIKLQQLSVYFQELRDLPGIVAEVLAEGRNQLNYILDQNEGQLYQFIDSIVGWETNGFSEPEEVKDVLESILQWLQDFNLSFEGYLGNFQEEHYQVSFYFLQRYLNEFNCIYSQLEAISYDRSYEVAYQLFQINVAETQIPIIEGQLALTQEEINQVELDLEAYPQYMVGNFQDSVPVLLMPVRIEAKFIHNRRDELPLNSNTTLKPETEPQVALWVRILPDDIAISSHEKKLTAQEFQAGQEYWNSAKDILSASRQSSQGASFDLGAWRVLSNRYGIYRGAWIVKETKPKNFNSVIVDYEDQLRHASDGVSIVLPAYEFPNLSLKDLSWSEPAQSHVLPDRFVLTLYPDYPSNDPKVIIGEKLPETLQVGFNLFNDDSEIDDIIDLLRNDDNLKWLVDFEEAIKVGMAFKVDLGDISLQNYKLDRLVVLGIKSTANEEESTELLQELIDSHHYTSGLKFPTLGTPTNNSTEPDSTGYSSSEDQDADNGYWIELGPALFGEASNHSEKADGQRLAEALGIKTDVFHHILNSQKQDVSEAIAMNTALWRGTLGYYLEQMLHPAISREDIAKTREFFVKNVQARGPLPSICVGKQPYGILPVSRLTAWTPLPDAHPFESGLNKILQAFDQEWDKLVPCVSFYGSSNTLSTTCGSTTPPVNSNHLLLQILGLEATSSEFYQRFGFGPGLVSNLNIATPSSDVLNPIYDYFLNLDLDLSSNSIISKILNVVFQNNTRKLIHTFRDNPNAVFPAGKLIDAKPFSEIRKIEPFYALSDNYIHWLMLSNFDELRKEDFSRLIQSGIFYNNHNPGSPQIPNLTGDPKAPRSLLYLMLRQALMLEYWNAAMQIKESLGETVAEDRIEKELFNILDASGASSIGTTPAREDIAPWEQLYSPSPYAADMAIYESLTVDSIQASEDAMQDLSENFMELRKLAEMPTARLERAFTEHLDLCSYRLDAWQTGQINQRILSSREGKSSGIYLGAFGFLEDLKPDSYDKAYHPGLYDFTVTDNENMGYIHAPSNKQAVAAAVLRHGYMSHKGPNNNDHMAVNLSSERVRKALDILAGIREGQRLEALLGYELERGMHERYNLPGGVELDQYIKVLRDKFPLVSKQILTSDDNEESKSTETIEARNVIDGLALLETAKGTLYPYGILAGLPDNSVSASSLDKAKANAIISEVARIANMLDAVNDLLLAESVYQTAQGNYDRANATLDSVAKGQFPPIPEVIQTPRSGFSLTNRVILGFDASANPSTSPGWGNYSVTPAALAEPSLNAWLGKLLGDPAQIKVKVGIIYSATQGGGGVPAITNVDVSIADLKLQPIDLIYLSEKNIEETGGEFHRRVENYVINNNVVTGVVDKVELSANLQLTGGAIHLRKLFPLVDRLREIVGGSKALAAKDILLPEQITNDPNQMIGVDFANLSSRVNGAWNGLDALRNALAGYLSSANYAGIPATLDSISYYGFPEAIPIISMLGSTNESVLLSIAQTVLASVNKRLIDANTLINQNQPNQNPPNGDNMVEAAKVIFGKGFKILPHFDLPTQSRSTVAGNKFSLQTAINNSNQVIYNPDDTPFIMDEWLQGVAKVKEKMEVLEKVSIFNELFFSETGNYFPLNLAPAQLPARYNSSGNYEDRWLGAYFGEDYEPDGDKLSLIMHLPTNYSTANKQVGLLVDEWVEVIPGRTETTEVAFHYDKPNSEPAQTLLLAVTPEITGSWKWDNLFEAVNETLDRAKKRAVDPDILSGTPFAQMLPAIVAPVDSEGITIGLDFGRTAGNSLFEPSEVLQPSS